MFTGIIEAIGKINAVDKNRIVIETSLQEIKPGDSVSVNGVCLTATKTEPLKKGLSGINFDCSKETFSRTNLSKLGTGDPVNLERALLAGGRLGGHFVTGHIDAVGAVVKIIPDNEIAELWEFRLPAGLLKYIAEKGSVAIDGISLTVAQKTKNTFTAAVIPYTRGNTVLQYKKINDTVNIETDILAKYVSNISEKSSGITMDKLREAGYL